MRKFLPVWLSAVLIIVGMTVIVANLLVIVVANTAQQSDAQVAPLLKGVGIAGVAVTLGLLALLKRPT